MMVGMLVLIADVKSADQVALEAGNSPSIIELDPENRASG
jgi:hypothetical protein